MGPDLCAPPGKEDGEIEKREEREREKREERREERNQRLT
jgi:hypothetical protein